MIAGTGAFGGAVRGAAGGGIAGGIASAFAGAGAVQVEVQVELPHLPLRKDLDGHPHGDFPYRKQWGIHGARGLTS